MALEARLNRMMPALSAHERAVAALEAWKDGRREDPWLRRSVPEQQEFEFARLLDLVRAVNGPLAWLAEVYEQKAQQYRLQLGWLQTLRLWGLTASASARDVLLDTPELVTASEYAQRLAESRAQTITIAEAAAFLAEREEDEDETAAAAVAHQEQRLLGAIAAGELVAHRRGRAAQVTMGGLDGWLGEESLVCPAWGTHVEVVADERAEDVRLARERAERARKALRRAPVGFAEDRPLSEHSSAMDRLGGDLCRSLATGLAGTVMEVAAMERCLEDVAQEFAGEDPLHPELRAGLVSVKAELASLVAEFGEGFAELAIPDPSAKDVERLHELLELAMR